MRFDDRSATVIEGAGSSAESRAAAWRQLVDLAAQSPGESSAATIASLIAWRPGVPLERRKAAARSLVGMRIPAGLFAFFAEDVPGVSAPLAASAHFSPETWRGLLPQLPVPVRALLRHRRDLDAATVQALASLGPADHVIAAPDDWIDDALELDAAQIVDAPPSPDPIDGGVQIRALVDRIEAYRRDHPLSPPTAPPRADRAEEFRFETGADGIVTWVEGAPRAPLMGLNLALTSGAPDHGVDGHAAGAWRRRSPFRDARLAVAGAGPASGEWRISAVPFFDARDGRFQGYRGAARRPRADEIAHAGLYGSSLAPDSLRQLVHELRTPLNAILGFAEMIDGQILGPAARDYRRGAVEIVGEARRLLAAVDDLDTAARVDSSALVLERSTVDGGALLRRTCAELAPLTDERGVHLRVTVSEPAAISADAAAAERMFGRLLAATMAVSERGEALDARLEGAGEMVVFRLARPLALAGQDEQALLDPGYSPEGDWPDAPLLGLGFALRLVRNLAVAAGGRFAIANDWFELALPGALIAPLTDEGRG